MITQKIEKYEEPKPYVYTATTYSGYPATQNVFTPVEIAEAVKLAEDCGLIEGLELEHTITQHKIKLIGFNTKDPRGYKGKPAVIKAYRKRADYEWETNFTVDELLGNEFVVTSVASPI